MQKYHCLQLCSTFSIFLSFPLSYQLQLRLYSMFTWSLNFPEFPVVRSLFVESSTCAFCLDIWGLGLILPPEKQFRPTETVVVCTAEINIIYFEVHSRIQCSVLMQTARTRLCCVVSCLCNGPAQFHRCHQDQSTCQSNSNEIASFSSICC